MNSDLDGIETFIALAEAKGFRTAAARLGVSHSAVSQSLRRLEGRLGVSLVLRTTRSVRLTEAGERLYASTRPMMEDLRSAVASVGELSDEPRGSLRIHLSSNAKTLFGETFLVTFLTKHPGVRLDLVVSDAPVDIVAEGFDAGIQLGEVIDRDMVVVPVTGDLRLSVVAAPSYLARRGVPKHPRDLAQHDCLNWHPTASSPAYRWEFTERGRDFAVSVPARVLSTDAELNRRLVLGGVGVTLALTEHVREQIAKGTLVSVLEEYCTHFTGYSLYYPQRRLASRALTALADHIRVVREVNRHRGKRARK
jgi:DNA-binding transcriptional LysR family regulator